MQRIAVIGNGGRGKSTLARALGRYLRTLRRVHAMRPDLLQLVTKNGRAAKLVHLRSPGAMVRWLAEVTRTTVGVTD